MAGRKIDRKWVVHALKCRADGPDDPFCANDEHFPEASLPGFEKRPCEECPYYFDFNGCDLNQILLDAHELISRQ